MRRREHPSSTSDKRDCQREGYAAVVAGEGAEGRRGHRHGAHRDVLRGG